MLTTTPSPPSSLSSGAVKDNTSPKACLARLKETQGSPPESYEIVIQSLEPKAHFYKEDPYYLDLWLAYIKSKVDSGSSYVQIHDIFEELRTRGVGSRHAKFYIALSGYEMVSGHLDLAKAALQAGIEARVEGWAYLKESLASPRFQQPSRTSFPCVEGHVASPLSSVSSSSSSSSSPALRDLSYSYDHSFVSNHTSSTASDQSFASQMQSFHSSEQPVSNTAPDPTESKQLKFDAQCKDPSVNMNNIAQDTPSGNVKLADLLHGSRKRRGFQRMNLGPPIRLNTPASTPFITSAESSDIGDVVLQTRTSGLSQQPSSSDPERNLTTSSISSIITDENSLEELIKKFDNIPETVAMAKLPSSSAQSGSNNDLLTATSLDLKLKTLDELKGMTKSTSKRQPLQPLPILETLSKPVPEDEKKLPFGLRVTDARKNGMSLQPQTVHKPALVPSLVQNISGLASHQPEHRQLGSLRRPLAEARSSVPAISTAPVLTRPHPVPVFPKPSDPELSSHSAVAPSIPNPEVVSGDKDKFFLVNGKSYRRLEIIGRGGSSKVYKVMHEDSGTIYALKKIKMHDQDVSAVEGYMNEISLLRSLRSNERIIQLIDAQVSSNVILMILEFGEVDLAHMMQKRKDQALDLNFIRIMWDQMLRAVQAIHDKAIIHSDLKPANFLLVSGELKLIDFGIAKAIPNDTTNIHRDHQTGTVNYMSPESITFADTSKHTGGVSSASFLRIGRASDVWSLGCILYQLVYGRPPFSHLSMMQKLSHIVNSSVPIDFPPLLDVPLADASDLLSILRACLVRDPKARPALEDLLSHPFLTRKVIPLDARLVEYILRKGVSLLQNEPSDGKRWHEVSGQLYRHIIGKYSAVAGESAVSIPENR